MLHLRLLMMSLGTLIVVLPPMSLMMPQDGFSNKKAILDDQIHPQEFFKASLAFPLTQFLSTSTAQNSASYVSPVRIHSAYCDSATNDTKISLHPSDSDAALENIHAELVIDHNSHSSMIDRALSIQQNFDPVVRHNNNMQNQY
ncbi:uncharacterized protein LOC129295963 [Prosopis cineraria]|uniref:uncharacterized protein LOC129295963 n=1 Tax=Prosopis cineraria TaxID=364024 RepID=UPI002410803B|nr:uncharacterized protein LOC129295963 [Prosopis cineraria]